MNQKIYLKKRDYLHATSVSLRLLECFDYLRSIAEKMWSSSLYFPVLLVIASVFLVSPVPRYGCFAMAAIGSFMLIFCWDIMAVVFPTLLFCLLTTDFFEDYGFLIRNIPVLIGVAAAFAIHFVLYPAPVKRGKMTAPLIAVSLATILGGFGKISSWEYFSPMSLYYVLGLGPAMLGVYTMLYSQLSIKRNYDVLEKLLRTIYYAGVFAGIIVLNTYFVHIEEFLSTQAVIYMAYRNFCATVMLTALPCACLKSKRGTYRFGGMWFIYFCLLLSGSRSGLIFGTVLLVASLVLMYWQCDKEIRSQIKRMLPVLVPIVGILIGFMAAKLFSSRLIDGNLIYTSDSRYCFWLSGLKDFLSSPIFGIGLGNLTNSNIYIGVEGSMVWYHNSIIQILGSMGIVGVISYGWMYYTRIRLLITRRSAKTPIVALSVLGMFLISLTNPGEFCPLPNAFIIVALFAVLELLPNNK